MHVALKELGFGHATRVQSDERSSSEGGQHNPITDNERAQPTRILIVDDDVAIRHMVTNYLEGYNMCVASAAQGAAVARHFAVAEPGLIVLDLQLGDENGLELLRAIRSRSDVPIIVVTGHRRGENDQVVGLELSADDYMTKPFGLRELLARIRAVLRRREAGRVAMQRDQERARWRFNGWQLDRRTRQLTDPNGVPVALTKGEYALLAAFLAEPQRPLTREHLLQATRVHENVFDRSI